MSIVRRKLGTMLQQIVDPEDAFQSFWVEVLTGPFRPEIFESEETLKRYVFEMASNKIREYYRRYVGTEKRSLDHQAPLTAEPPARQPAAERVVEARERLDRLLSSFPEHWREAIRLVGEGYTYQEAAGLTDTPQRTVRRVIALVRRTQGDQSET
jgi:RNA polymerase sigma factor (sigma-70 family)